MKFWTMLIILLSATAVRAAIIHLTDGTSIEGKLAHDDDGWIVTQSDGSKIYVAAAKVASIEVSRSQSTPSQAAPTTRISVSRVPPLPPRPDSIDKDTWRELEIFLGRQRLFRQKEIKALEKRLPIAELDLKNLLRHNEITIAELKERIANLESGDGVVTERDAKSLAALNQRIANLESGDDVMTKQAEMSVAGLKERIANLESGGFMSPIPPLDLPHPRLKEFGRLQYGNEIGPVSLTFAGSAYDPSGKPGVRIDCGRYENISYKDPGGNGIDVDTTRLAETVSLLLHDTPIPQQLFGSHLLEPGQAFNGTDQIYQVTDTDLRGSDLEPVDIATLEEIFRKQGGDPFSVDLAEISPPFHQLGR